MDWIDSGKTIGLDSFRQNNWIALIEAKQYGWDSFRQNNWIGLIQAKQYELD